MRGCRSLRLGAAAAEVAPREAEPAKKDAGDTDDQGRDRARDVPGPDHRLPEMRRHREVLDELGKVEERAEQLHEPRDHEEDHDRRGGPAGADHASDQHPDPDQRHGVDAQDQRAGDRRGQIAATGGDADRDPERAQDEEDGDVDQESHAARERPAKPRQRGREDHLQPAGGLVGGPASDEGRGGEASEQDTELDEEQLEEAAGRGVVDAGEGRLEQVHERR